MHIEVYKLLKSIGLKASKEYLKKQLETHPYYPSILAIKDTLEELNLEVEVSQILPHNLKELKYSFIAHCKNKNNEDFHFYKDGLNLSILANSTKEINEVEFTGIILATNLGSRRFGNAENSNHLNLENQKLAIKTIFFISSFALLLFPFLISHFDLVFCILLSANLFGFIFSYLIIEKEFGISNYISDMICKLSNKVGCETVLFSKGAKVFKWLSWGDIGLVYFATIVTYLTCSGLSKNISIIPIFLVSTIAILFIFYSLYYQFKVVKQFCMLCLGVLLVIIINFSISILTFTRANFSMIKLNMASVYFYLLLAFLILSIWLLFKDMMGKNNKNLIYSSLYKRLKRNPSIFLSVLKWNPSISECVIASNESISFGNPAAPFNLVIACNPYCNPCAIAHNLVNDLYNKFPDQIQVGIRFSLTVESSKKDNDKGKVVRHLLQYIKENPKEVSHLLHFWYNNMSYEKLVSQFPVINLSDVEDIILYFVDWNKKLSIKGTPTFWLNGKQLPEIFNWVDLFEQLPIIIEDSLENPIEFHQI